MSLSKKPGGHNDRRIVTLSETKSLLFGLREGVLAERRSTSRSGVYPESMEGTPSFGLGTGRQINNFGYVSKDGRGDRAPTTSVVALIFDVTVFYVDTDFMGLYNQVTTR